MGHRFSYRVLNLLIDLDRLDAADRLSRLFRVNARGLYSFHERDHGPRDGTSLRAHASRLAGSVGIDLTGGRVRLLCYPRLLGYAFNPLSIYYCEDAKKPFGSADLRGPQHIRRTAYLCLSGAARRAH